MGQSNKLLLRSSYREFAGIGGVRPGLLQGNVHVGVKLDGDRILHHRVPDGGEACGGSDLARGVLIQLLLTSSEAFIMLFMLCSMLLWGETGCRPSWPGHLAGAQPDVSVQDVSHNDVLASIRNLSTKRRPPKNLS
jgi:hypothetical protein